MRSFSLVNWSSICSVQLLNMIESDFTILLSPCFHILMDTSSCPWALLITSALIILYISSSSILKDDSLVSVIYVRFSGNLLSFGKRLH